MSKAGTVLFAPVGLARVDSRHSLTTRYETILSELVPEKMVRGKTVAVKIHLGGGQSYTCTHPTFIRRAVEHIRRRGGKPFVTDSGGDYNPSCGYTRDVLECPVYPAAGLANRYFYARKTGTRLLPTVEVAGFIHDADVLINLSHAKGHGHASYGGAIKNLAMGAVTGNTRRDVHATMCTRFSWDPERCTRCGVCIQHCRGKALSFNEKKELVVNDHNCFFCGRCIALCTRRAITANESRWGRFQKALALSAREVLRSFAPGSALHINVILNVTALCDCFGVGQASLVPDVGIMASADMVAVEQATLDAIGAQPFFPEAVPGGRVALEDNLHPFHRTWGKDPYVQVKEAEKLKLGTASYRLKRIE